MADTDLDNDLVCSICQDILYQPLTLLDCTHTFCGNCLKKWFYSQAQAARSIHPYTCPACRAVVRDTKRSPLVCNVLDWFLKANPSRDRTPEEKAEADSLYKPGDVVLPKLKRKSRNRTDQYYDDENILQQVIRLSQEEALASIGSSPSSSQQPDANPDGPSTPRPEGRDIGTSVLYRSEPRTRGRQQSSSVLNSPIRDSTRSIEHQASLRSLISIPDTDVADEISRQIAQNGLFAGVDLSDMTPSQEDQLRDIAAQAYRRLEEERTRDRRQRMQASSAYPSPRNPTQPLLQSSPPQSPQQPSQPPASPLPNQPSNSLPINQPPRAPTRTNRPRTASERRDGPQRSQPSTSVAASAANPNESTRLSRTHKPRAGSQPAPHQSRRRRQSPSPAPHASVVPREVELTHRQVSRPGTTLSRTTTNSPPLQSNSRTTAPSASGHVDTASTPTSQAHPTQNLQSQSQSESQGRTQTTVHSYSHLHSHSHSHSHSRPHSHSQAQPISNDTPQSRSQGQGQARARPRPQQARSSQNTSPPGGLHVRSQSDTTALGDSVLPQPSAQPNFEVRRPSSSTTATDSNEQVHHQSSRPTQALLATSVNADSSAARPLETFVEPSISCRRCPKSDIQYDIFYVCDKCGADGYCICQSCYRLSKGCEHWFGFGWNALLAFEKTRPVQGHPSQYDPPHVMTPHRYLKPHTIFRRDAKPMSTENPLHRLQRGVFCDSCSDSANDWYWRCDKCNQGEWGFCPSCVNLGYHCTHPLYCLQYVDQDGPMNSPPADAVSGAAQTSSQGSPKSTSSSLFANIRGGLRPKHFNTQCDICKYLITPSVSRYHCPACNQGDYDIHSDCYVSMVKIGHVSPENGHQGWRRCLRGHRMIIMGFDDRADGQRVRIVTRDLIGGRRNEGAHGGRGLFPEVKDGRRVTPGWKWSDGRGITCEQTLSHQQQQQQQQQEQFSKHHRERDSVTNTTVTTSGTSGDDSPSSKSTLSDDFHDHQPRRLPPDGGAGLHLLAWYSYFPEPGVTDELMFPKGAEITEAQDVNGDWLWGVYAGKGGLFPGPPYTTLLRKVEGN